MRAPNSIKVISFLAAIALPLFAATPVFAADAAPGVSQAQNFLTNMVNILASFGGILATGALVWGGIMYVTSSGNLQNIDKAKTILKYAAIGLVIIIVAAAIVNFLSTTAKSAFGA